MNRHYNAWPGGSLPREAYPDVPREMLRGLRIMPHKITPEEYAKAGTEHAEQVAVFIWANDVREQYPDLDSLFAVPNGGLRNKATAGRLKAEGVKEGVSDLFLPVIRYDRIPSSPGGPPMQYVPFHGLFIEMKKARSAKVRNDDPQFGATPEQRKFIALMKSRGYAATVCHGWIEASEVLLSYLRLPCG